jgi:hypothetical protein
MMTVFRAFLLASLFSATFAEAALATTIFTPPVIPDDDSDFFCLVTNVSPRTLDAST